MPQNADVKVSIKTKAGSIVRTEATVQLQLLLQQRILDNRLVLVVDLDPETALLLLQQVSVRRNSYVVYIVVKYKSVEEIVLFHKDVDILTGESVVIGRNQVTTNCVVFTKNVNYDILVPIWIKESRSF